MAELKINSNNLLTNINKSVLSSKLDKAKVILNRGEDKEVRVEILIAGKDGWYDEDFIFSTLETEGDVLAVLKKLEKDVDKFIKSWYDLFGYKIKLVDNEHHDGDVVIMLEKLVVTDGLKDAHIVELKVDTITEGIVNFKE